MLVLDGKLVSRDRRDRLKTRVAGFLQKTGRAPHLTVIIVGEHLPSQVYVRNKVKACAEVGFTSEKLEIPASISAEDFKSTLRKVEENPAVDGVLVQLPLPPQLQSLDLAALMDPLKDADGFTYRNLGQVVAGRSAVAPCTPKGIMSILEHYQISVRGLSAVVVGRSLIVGKPMSWLLTDADATVTVCHSKTPDLRQYTSQADLVVVAAGKKQFLGREDFRRDSIVIDVGMHGSGQGGGVCGDVRYSELSGWVKAATPVPGGVGPMTITTLLENTMTLAEIRAGIKI